MDAKEKAIEVAKELQNMPVSGPHVYVATLDRRDRYQVPGRVFLVPRLYAAKLLVEGTHTYANDQQIAEYERELMSRQTDIHRQLREETQKFQIMLTPELIAAAGGHKPVEDGKGKGR